MQWISLTGLVVAGLGIFPYLWHRYLIEIPLLPGGPTEADIERYSKFANLSKYIGGIAGIFFFLTLILRYVDTSRIDTLSTFFGTSIFIGSALLINGLGLSFYSRRKLSQSKKKMEKEEGDAIKHRFGIGGDRTMQYLSDMLWCTGAFFLMLGIWYGIWFPV